MKLAWVGTYSNPVSSRTRYSLSLPRSLFSRDRATCSLVVQGGHRRHLPEPVDVEGQLDLLQRVAHRPRGDDVSHPQPRQPVDLGEGAGDDQVGVVIQVCQGIGMTGVGHVFDVGLVQDQQDAGGERLQHQLEFLPGDRRSGGVEGRAERHVLGALAHRREHGRNVLAVIAQGHVHGLRPHGHGGQFVGGEGRLPHHDLVAPLQEGEGHEVEGLVRAVTDHDAVHVHPQLARQGFPQLDAVAVGVDVDLRQRLAHGLHGQG